MEIAPAPTRARQRRALRLAVAANAAVLVAEVWAGLAFGSLALLADAAHLATDVAGLAIALVAQRLLDRPASAKHSYGLQRAEILAAQANALLLLGAAGVIIVEAVRRLTGPGDGAEVPGLGLLLVAALGLAVNLGSAALLARSEGRSLNLRAARVHMLADAAGSGVVLLAGAVILLAGAAWVDSAAAILVAALVLWAAWRLLTDTVHVLLEGTPRDLPPERVEALLLAQPGVTFVHHLHLWTLASETPAMPAHVGLAGDLDLHTAQATGDRLKRLLAQEFGLQHTTLELECHACAPAAHV